MRYVDSPLNLFLGIITLNISRSKILSKLLYLRPFTRYDLFLSPSSSQACASRDHFFLFADFHELSVPDSSLKLTTIGYVSTGMGESFSALLVLLMALWLALVDQNPFWPCF